MPEALTWRRRIVTKDSQGRAQTKVREEGRALILVPAGDLVERIVSGTLDSWVTESRGELGGKHVTLIIYGLEDYLKEYKNVQERLRKAKIRGEKLSTKDENLLAHPVARDSVELALISLSFDGLADSCTFDMSREGKTLCKIAIDFEIYDYYYCTINQAGRR